MRKFTAIATLTLTAAGLLAGCATTPAGKPIPQAQDGTVETTAPKAAKAPSTCDLVREALLTGTQAEIDQAMAALQADVAADATAREYADYYQHRDAAEPSMRSMDVDLIRMSCPS